MGIDSQVALNILFMLFTAGAIYGAIRTDIKNLHFKAEELARSINRAHERLDNLMEGKHHA